MVSQERVNWDDREYVEQNENSEFSCCREYQGVSWEIQWAITEKQNFSPSTFELLPVSSGVIVPDVLIVPVAITHPWGIVKPIWLNQR